MRTIPAAAKTAMRDIDFKIVTNDDSTTYTTANIITANIQRSITEGGISIGNVISDRFSAVLRIDDTIPKKTRIQPYIKFGSSDWLKIGKFYCYECNKSQHGYINVVAYDYLSLLDKKCTWKASSNGRVSALSFPATYQQMLDYIITRFNLSCTYECQAWTQQTKPEGYTYRQLLGFIAASHCANCKINDDGAVDFIQFTDIGNGYQLTQSNVISQTIDDTAGYTVNGILITVNDDDSIYIDDVDGSEYDEDAEGIVKVNNPLASIEIAEYCWNLLGGLSYINTTIVKRATTALQVGDVFPIYDLAGEEPEEVPNAIVTSIEYDISAAGGFTETITSFADTSENSTVTDGGKVSNNAQSIEYDDDINRLTVHTASGDEIYNLTVEGDRVTFVEHDGAIMVTAAETAAECSVLASKAINKFAGKKVDGVEFDFYNHYPNDFQDFRPLFSCNGTQYGTTYTIDYGDGTAVETGGIDVLFGHVFGAQGYFRVKISTDATSVFLYDPGQPWQQATVKPREFWVGGKIENVLESPGGYSPYYISCLVFADSVKSISWAAWIGYYYFKATGKFASVRLSKKLETISTAYAFNHSFIRGVCIPASVSNIAGQAFHNCPFQNITIEGGSTELTIGGVDLFYGNGREVATAGVSKITIPGRLKVIPTRIGQYLGAYIIDIKEGVTTISYSAFQAIPYTRSAKRSALHVNIPLSVTSIGSSAFYYNDQFLHVHYAGTLTQWETVEKGNSWANTDKLSIYYENAYAGDGVDEYTPPQTAGYNTSGVVKVPYSGGISIDSSGNIALKPASANQIGGVKVGDGLQIDENGLLSATGGASSPATTETLGGVIVGDGLNVETDGTLSVDTNELAPTYTVETEPVNLTSGEKLSAAFGKIATAISSLITHIANTVSHITDDERTAWNGKADPYSAGENITIDGNEISATDTTYTAGDGIDISDNVISASGGGGTTYTAGNAIDLTADEISVKYDNDKIKLNDNGQLTTDPLVIENAVILSEDQAAYILHEYEEISYVSGQRAIWGTAGRNIITQGITVEETNKLGFVANQPTWDLAYPNGRPAYYTQGTVTTCGSATATPITRMWELYLDTYSADRYYYYIRYSDDGGITWIRHSTRYISWYDPTPGIFFVYGNIVPVADANRPYGYANLVAYIDFQSSSTESSKNCSHSSVSGILPSQFVVFQSEAERNAAIALTYEPQTLTTVNETLAPID